MKTRYCAGLQLWLQKEIPQYENGNEIPNNLGNSFFCEMPKDTEKNDIKAFWGSLYYSLYYGVDRKLNQTQLLEALDQLEDMFRFRNHMAVVDIKFLMFPELLLRLSRLAIQSFLQMF